MPDKFIPAEATDRRLVLQRLAKRSHVTAGCADRLDKLNWGECMTELRANVPPPEARCLDLRILV